MARERDEARWEAARAPPGPPPTALPPMPDIFLFGSFQQLLTQNIPICSPPPRQPSPFVSPTQGFGSIEPVKEVPFLSAKGSLLTHVELSRDMRRIKEQEEERRRGTALRDQANLRVDQELVDLQTTWLQMQSRLDKFFGEGRVPPSLQDAVNMCESQLIASRQGLRILENHGPHLAAQFQG